MSKYDKNKFDKNRFSELLKKAKGTRSINQYALESGVSAAHISRLLRGLLDTPPSPDIIEKLSEISLNGVNYYELMDAAGHISGHVEKKIKSPYDVDYTLYDENGNIQKIRGYSKLIPNDDSDVCSKNVHEEKESNMKSLNEELIDLMIRRGLIKNKLDIDEYMFEVIVSSIETYANLINNKQEK